MPEDLLWTWVASCSEEDPSRMITSFGYDADGRVHVEVSETGLDGAPITDDVGGVVVDAPATRSLSACLSDRRVATSDRLIVATPADRLELYRWALAWQVPCLRGSGFEVALPAFADFVEPNVVPWYLLGSADVTSVPFERVLDARWRCDPIPPIVGPSGWVW
ncbi:hypothetical protein FJ656_13385 [Schumannella luteola]|nr:hypothetical protein FJ656_13385 [Schumannella luteola]